MVIRVTGILLLAAVLLGGCGKASNQVPNVAVNITANLVELPTINQGVTISGGVAGIILYRLPVNGGGIVAYDRCSTVNPEKRCAVVLNGDFTATDPCSGAKYSLLDGSPAKAPATISLTRYTVSVSGTVIRITN